jgi:hypothetical protein
MMLAQDMHFIQEAVSGLVFSNGAGGGRNRRFMRCRDSLLLWYLELVISVFVLKFSSPIIKPNPVRFIIDVSTRSLWVGQFSGMRRRASEHGSGRRQCPLTFHHRQFGRRLAWLDRDLLYCTLLLVMLHGAGESPGSHRRDLLMHDYRVTSRACSTSPSTFGPVVEYDQDSAEPYVPVRALERK